MRLVYQNSLEIKKSRSWDIIRHTDKYRPKRSTDVRRHRRNVKSNLSAFVTGQKVSIPCKE